MPKFRLTRPTPVRLPAAIKLYLSEKRFIIMIIVYTSFKTKLTIQNSLYKFGSLYYKQKTTLCHKKWKS